MKEGDFPVEVNSRVVETKLGPVEYAEAGEGPPLLIVHGGPGGCDQGIGMGGMFPPAGFRVVAPSRPGYLGTPLSVGATIPEQADILAALVETLGLGRVFVLGVSAGGPPSYEMAARHPDKVRALVCVDAVSGPYKIPEQAGKIEQAIFLSRPGEWLLNALARHFPSLVVSNMLKTEGYLTSKELGERVKAVVKDPEKLRYARILTASMDHYERRRAGVDNDLKQMAALKPVNAAAIRVPTLVVHGTADADVQFSDADYAASNIPGAEHFWVNRGTHLCFWFSEQAGEAQAAVINFLRKH